MRFVIISLVLLPLAGFALSQEVEETFDLDDVREEAVRTILADLESLAAWCVENKLLLCRDDCYRVLIRFDTEHRKARRTLKFTKQGDGSWKQGHYRAPVNKNKDETLVPEYYKRLEAVNRKLIEGLHTALASADVDTRPEVKDRVLEDILRADPDEPRARKIRGEVKLDGEWVLEETATAKKRYKVLRRAAKQAIDDAKPPKDTTPDDVEGSLGLSWTGKYQGGWWRGLGTVNTHELERAVKVLDASLPFFNEAMGTRAPQPSGCGFYLLRGKSDAATALKKHPSFTEEQRKYYLTLKAAWIPGRHYFFQWNDSPGVRLDGAVRNSLGSLLKTFGINTKRGWVWEGVGLYLDYHLTGSHRTVFVTKRTHTTTKRRKVFDIEARMKEPGANWILIARQMVDNEIQPDIEIATAKPVNRLDPEELIYGHALAAYVIEGFPEKTEFFFRMHGIMQPIRETVPIVFGLSLPKFVERFHRWLREVT